MVTEEPPRLFTMMVRVPDPVGQVELQVTFTGTRFSEVACWSRWLMLVMTWLYASYCMKPQSMTLNPMSMIMTKNSPPKIVLMPFLERASRLYTLIYDTQVVVMTVPR